MAALAVWGIYLAVGATGYFTEESLFDPRKSLIVAVASTSFLLLWVFVLNAVDRRKQVIEGPELSIKADGHSSVGSTRTEIGWSVSGFVTVAIGVFGFLLWGLAIAIWPADDTKRNWLLITTVTGWLAAISMVGSATAGMITLSNPRKMKGKWLGLLGLVFCAGSFIGFVIRMTP